MQRELGVFNKGNIRAIKRLTEREYADYRDTIKWLMFFEEDQQLFRVVYLNYVEFKDLLKTMLEQYQEDQAMSWSKIRNTMLNTNRKLLNFLSSCRTFLDHSIHTIIKRYGRNSKRHAVFKEVCSKTYDSCFSYRFFSKLRNYVQHCGMPVGEVVFSSKELNSTKGTVAFEVSVMFDRDALLRNYDSWGAVEGEIKKLPEKFEIAPHVEEMMKCVMRIYAAKTMEDKQVLVGAIKQLENFIAQLEENKGTPCIFTTEDLTGDKRNLEINIEWIPIHLIDILREEKVP